MNAPLIYFDNAATTHPKPDEVYAALDSALRRGGNSGRGAHALALAGARTIFECRESIAEFLGASKSERLVFTPGCTYSINIALKSLCAAASKDSTVLISGLEHNAVMRPLARAQKRIGFEIKSLPYSPGSFCAVESLEQELTDYKPTFFILTEGSNVTGEVADIAAVAKLCQQASVPLLVDAAQTAGRAPGCLSNSDSGITLWCASAHKGLMGPQGLGLLYVHPDFELDSFVEGGTGSASEQLDMPIVYPDHLEPGTMPTFLIAGLNAGIEWLRKTGVEKISAHENGLHARFLDWCTGHPEMQIYGKSEGQLPTVSFALKNKSPEVVAEYLQTEAQIAVRSGLHCAVTAHRALGTETTGLVRASFGFFNTAQEVDVLCHTLEKLSKS